METERHSDVWDTARIEDGLVDAGRNSRGRMPSRTRVMATRRAAAEALAGRQPVARGWHWAPVLATAAAVVVVVAGAVVVWRVAPGGSVTTVAGVSEVEGLETEFEARKLDLAIRVEGLKTRLAYGEQGSLWDADVHAIRHDLGRSMVHGGGIR